MYSKYDVYIAQYSAELFVLVAEGVQPENIVPRNIQERLGGLSLYTVIDTGDAKTVMPEIMLQALEVVRTKGFFVVGGHSGQPQ